jgi:hypothetical protein
MMRRFRKPLTGLHVSIWQLSSRPFLVVGKRFSLRCLRLMYCLGGIAVTDQAPGIIPTRDAFCPIRHLYHL